jgi:uncharacterized RDD family membrane protein YckC
MTCSYCGTPLAQGEERCSRCGRKGDDLLTGGFRLVTTGALASAPARAPRARPASRTAPDMARAVQASLFPNTLDSSVVMIAPVRAKPANRKRRTKTGSRAPEGQGTLDFIETTPSKPRTLGTTVEASIYCDAQAARPLHRAVAAAFDWALVLIAWGVFLLAFRLLGGQIVLNKTNLMVYSATLLLIGFTYGLLAVIAGIETQGMRWTQLRLTTFDGFPPELHHRVLRMIGSCLSVCTVVGLLWSLVDEEGLAWQDHISGTFPTLAVDR